MMDEKTFRELAREIEAQGISRELALRYAELIGDLPVRDADGNILVMDAGRQLARLKPLKIFQTS